MAGNPTSRRKRKLSWHQKQIRFFTISAVIMGLGLVVTLLWFLNRSSLPAH